MGIIVRAGGAPRAVAAITVRVGGIERAVRTARLMAGGTLRTVWTSAPPPSLAISPAYAFAFGAGFVLTTGTVTATPTGGTAPYTYVWTILSWDDTEPVITSPTFASTRFSQPMLSDATTATFRCTVTDSLGNTASDDIIATFSRLY